MSNNLIAELVKKGIAPRNVAAEIAKAISVSERTARNKLTGATEWTLPEAVTINDHFFGGEMNIEYLFAKPEKGARV